MAEESCVLITFTQHKQKTSKCSYKITLVVEFQKMTQYIKSNSFKGYLF